MQLGELQSQLPRFDQRNAQILALSVDRQSDSLAMASRLNLQFPLLADPQQTAVNAFRVQNPDTRELALHAVYIVDSAGEIFYRKVGLRRPTSNELIDAIDAHAGRYPQHDVPQAPDRRINVAYPRNNFQALIEMAQADALPKRIPHAPMRQVVNILKQGEHDPSLIRFKNLMESLPEVSEQDMLIAAAWLTREVFLGEHLDHSVEAISTGKLLIRRLERLQQFEQAHSNASNEDEKDRTLHDLARARGGLTLTRSTISNNAAQWRLKTAKAMMRSYREVARAAVRARTSDLSSAL